jgi:hypothetical protein
MAGIAVCSITLHIEGANEDSTANRLSRRKNGGRGKATMKILPFGKFRSAQRELPGQPMAKKLTICQGIVLMEAILIALMAGIEIGGRLIGYDFNHSAERIRALPPSLRIATVPVGEAYFRKPGPANWRGRYQTALFEEMGYRGQRPSLEDDPEVIHEYDDLGFRNPRDLIDWEIVIAGDSFTELPTVSHEDLFTVRLGKALGVRVKNLGASMTGTLAQTCYLQEFGKAASTRHALVVFYEGNDLDDLVGGTKGLWQARRGNREDRSLEELPRQTSFLKAIYNVLKGPEKVTIQRFDGFYEHDGRRVPIRLSGSAPGGDLPSVVRGMLVNSLQGWAETAKRLRLKPWLVFMPCKSRVFHKHVQFMEDAPPNLVRWKPNDLPDLIRAICKDADIEFIDVTPRLMAETEQGRLTYPPLDSHLNRLGSMCVAEVLTERLGREFQPKRSP